MAPGVLGWEEKKKSKEGRIISCPELMHTGFKAVAVRKNLP